MDLLFVKYRWARNNHGTNREGLGTTLLLCKNFFGGIHDILYLQANIVPIIVLVDMYLCFALFFLPILAFSIRLSIIYVSYSFFHK